MTNKITMEVFRTGKHTDSGGTTREWTKKDLDKIVEHSEATDEKGNKLHKTPICIGHPEGDTPAQGWIGRFYRKGKSLFAETESIRPKFFEALKEKMFRTRSIALRGDLSPRHLAFLGGQSPAVKGLQDLSFSDDEFSLNFSEDDKKFNSFDIDNELEFNEKTFIKELNDILNKINFFKEKENDMPELKALKDELKAEKAKSEKLDSSFKELETKLKEVESKYSELDTKVKEENKALKEAEFSDFADSIIKEGVLLPANKGACIQMQKTLDGQDEIEFSENGETKKITPIENYRETMKKGSKVISFGEEFDNGSVPKSAGDALSAKIKEKMENKEFGFSEASRLVYAENPELTLKYESEL